MTKRNVFHTIWCWSSLVYKLNLNEGFLWRGCCVCEHTLNLVVFHPKSSYCVFTLSFCTWFRNGMYFKYLFIAMFFPITIALHTFFFEHLKECRLQKISRTWAL